jgi:2-polyprenyl-3-methyl-5-hydroxy-6-metoxy-1,4-benzoquinol methylase
MMEHCQNQISTIENYLRILKPNGIFYLAMLDKRYKFDIVRPVTSLKHLIHEYQEKSDWFMNFHFEK